MFLLLQPDDFLAAVEELQSPKVRSYSKEGYLLVQQPKQRTTVNQIFHSTTVTVVRELNELLSNERAEGADKIKNIVAHEPLMKNNLNHMIERIVIENSKPKPSSPETPGR